MNRVEKTHLPVAALTHPGMKGKNNEDRFGVAAFRMQNPAATPVLLAVLSDGIGGHRAGEVASEIAVNAISQYAADSDGRSPQRILGEAIQFASQLIFQQAQDNVDRQGMGATCACVWISGDRLFTATVGDSRIYLMRAGGIKQLSTDHTWIQEALERGLIEPDEVNGHPNAHVIRRYLGSPTPPEVDFRMRLNGEQEDSQLLNNQGFHLQPGDVLLLCSDGLTDLVSDEEIQAAFTRDTLENAGQNLIDVANERGGHDNITLIAISIPVPGAAAVEATAPVKPVRARSLSRSLLVGCLGVILLAALVGGLAGGYYLFFAADAATVTPTAEAEGTETLLPPLITYTPTRTRRATVTQTPFVTITPTPTRRSGPSSSSPNAGPTITPWPTSTRTIRPTLDVPVVTVNP